MGKAKPVDKANRTDVISVEQITNSILAFRGHKLLLDAELATPYGVTTGRLNEAVKRNLERFTPDFMFQLTAAEHAALISQIATSRPGRGGRRKLPWVFTEHGAIQAANVLNSPRAVEMGIYVVPAFVKLRELLASNRELARRFQKLVAHDQALGVVLHQF
jgi:ORF6N domain